MAEAENADEDALEAAGLEGVDAVGAAVGEEGGEEGGRGRACGSRRGRQRTCGWRLVDQLIHLPAVRREPGMDNLVDCPGLAAAGGRQVGDLLEEVADMAEEEGHGERGEETKGIDPDAARCMSAGDEIEQDKSKGY